MKQPAAIAMSLTACVLLSACASPQPVRYTGIGSAPYLTANQQNESGHIPYRFASAVDWSGYSKVMIDPVAIYQGADNQFGQMSGQDKATLARYMQKQFAEALGKRFTLTSTPGPGTLRVTLTLTGARSTGLIGMFAHVDMAGNVYNGIQAVRGREGLRSGWVMYAAEIRDAATGSLLEAFEEKQYPNAFNIAAALGALSAAKIGLEKGADQIVAELK